MPITKLDHVNIRTSDVERLAEWYVAALGFERGWRPDFGFDGAWLYCGGAPLVHLVAASAPLAADADGIQLEHAAFAATDLKAFIDGLALQDVAWSAATPPGAGVVQVHVRDPDGNHLHIDFPATEAEGVL